LMPDRTAPHPRPFYTPIADIDGKFIAEPVSFGMRFAQQFAGATMIALDFDPGEVNATAYAAHFSGETLIAVINKDTTRPIEVSVAAGTWAITQTLTADSLNSTKVTLAPARGTNRTVPPSSAAIFHPVSRIR
jgi:hypothetical protein